MTPASSSRPLTCYPTHGKRLAQHGDCRILRRSLVSPSPQHCRCPPERHRAPTHERKQHSEWSEPSPPGGTARLEIGTPRRRPPLSSGPISVWRQPSLSADLRSPRVPAGGSLLEPEKPARVAAEGAIPFRKERRDRSEVMLIRPQQAHESSTNASSACWKPRH